ncbi:transposase, partial [Paraburkholderia sp. BR14320]|uniref:transposase n=1 Tax=unclassified Paraburkholderia TaxID=2615204 RepID=UPI0034CEA7AA
MSVRSLLTVDDFSIFVRSRSSPAVKSGYRQCHPLMEQVQYNLLFRWFIGLAMDDVVWVPTVFTKNRERLIKHDAV